MVICNGDEFSHCIVFFFQNSYIVNVRLLPPALFVLILAARGFSYTRLVSRLNKLNFYVAYCVTIGSNYVGV